MSAPAAEWRGCVREVLTPGVRLGRPAVPRPWPTHTASTLPGGTCSARPGIPTGRGSGLKNRTVWVRTPAGAPAGPSESPHRPPPAHRLVAVEPRLQHTLAAGEVRELVLEVVQPCGQQPRVEAGEVAGRA